MSRRTLDAEWPARGARRLSTVRAAGARRAAMTIEEHRDAGHRFTGVGYGRFVVPPGAHEVRYAPVGRRWARYLNAQVLPVVAGLHGRELLHAGGIVIAPGAVAICGVSGAGKTTLTRACVEAGARFLADDVVALAQDGDRHVTAHPGPAIAAVVEEDGAEQMVPAPDIAGPARLHAVCMLRRGRARTITFEPVAPEDPRPLLAACYEAVRRDPQRMLTQLDLLAAVAAQARIVELHAPARATPQALAAALLEELA